MCAAILPSAEFAAWLTEFSPAVVRPGTARVKDYLMARLYISPDMNLSALDLARHRNPAA